MGSTSLFLWDFFAEGTKSGLTSLHARGFLLTRARCPAWILVVTSISNQLITLAVFSVTIMIFLLAVGRPPSVGGVALFAAYVGALVAIVTGFSLGSSVVYLRYRDLNQVWDLVSQAGFFVAPIIYPLGILPERLHQYLYIWPPTPIIEFSRQALVRGEVPTDIAHGLMALVVAASLLVGSLVFRRLGPRAAEYL